MFVLFSRLPYILYRDYPDFGYLTDNRNLGYDTASKSCVKVGERILSKTGSVFFSVLTEKPQSIPELSERLLPLFRGVSLLEIEKDASAFFLELSQDGFISCDEEASKANRLDYFSYANRETRALVELGDPTDRALTIDWGSEYRLTRIHVDISGLCNEHCVHCYIPDKFKNKAMSCEMFWRILEQSQSCNVLNITISGGEPMLNPNLLDFVRSCRSDNFSVNLLSNLTLLNDEMVSEFERSPLLSIQTSLYSMIPEVHDSITNSKGSFAKTKRAIEVLYKHNIPMQINCPVMKQNKDSYQGVLDWAKSLNIEASSDFMLFGCFDGSGKNLQCRLELSEVEDVIRNEKQSQVQAKEHQYNPESNSSICPVCSSSICVSHLGDVYPCEGWQSLILGNIMENTISQIWEESPAVHKLRNLSIRDFPKCQSCADKDFCSICLLRNVNESPTLDYKDVNPYFCEIAKLKKLLAEDVAK